MSFDLSVLSISRPVDRATAGRLHIALCEGATEPLPSPLVRSGQLAAFARALLARYPDIDTLPEDALDTSPWSVAPEITDAYAVLNFIWPRAEEALVVVRELAAVHGLSVYDPQADEVHSPPGERPAPPRWQFWRR